MSLLVSGLCPGHSPECPVQVSCSPCQPTLCPEQLRYDGVKTFCGSAGRVLGAPPAGRERTRRCDFWAFFSSVFIALWIGPLGWAL